VKKRTRQLSEFFQSYEPYSHKIGEVQDVLVTEVSHDGKHYVGHNKFYEQVITTEIRLS
jgi:threonylcarbamoyladenosine tRNA methylthiotransferase CDKAL1